MLIKDLRLYDHELFFNYFHVSPTTYEKLLRFVAVDLTKVTTRMREPICPGQRLAITLSMAWLFVNGSLS